MEQWQDKAEIQGSRLDLLSSVWEVDKTSEDPGYSLASKYFKGPSVLQQQQNKLKCWGAPPAGHDVAGPHVRGRLKRWQAPGRHQASI